MPSAVTREVEAAPPPVTLPPRTRAELHAWMQQDLAAYQREGIFPAPRWRWWHRLHYPLIAWQRTLRRTEYVASIRRGRGWQLWVFFWKWQLMRASIRLNLEIPIHVFGPGLVVVHFGSIVINPRVRVGANCRLHPGVCLGEYRDQNPVLGNDVYLGNGAIVIGAVTVGDRARIGPHALVRESVPEDAVAVSQQAWRAR